MPGKITFRQFQSYSHIPDNNLPQKPYEKTKIDPSDVFGTDRGRKFHNPTVSDRQEGISG